MRRSGNTINEGIQGKISPEKIFSGVQLIERSIQTLVRLVTQSFRGRGYSTYLVVSLHTCRMRPTRHDTHPLCV